MSPKSDMTGKKFGRLTVIEEAGRDKNRHLLWRCICKCGNETIVNGSSLRRGRSKSCGCYRSEHVSENTKIDIARKKFGRLVVIDEAGRSKQGKILWRCLCDCGNETIVAGTSLRNGSIKSCGCYSRECASERQLGKEWSMEERVRISCTKQGISYEEWEGFASNSPYCPAFDNACRESNREKYGRRCFLSGLPEKENITSTGKTHKLSVHHYDMDKMQGCDGKRWKLVPLCLEYHGKAHTKLWESRIIWLLKNVWN